MKTLHLCLHRAHYPDYLGKMDEKYSTNSVHILSQRRVSFMIFNFCLFHKALQRKGTHTVYNLTLMQPLFNYYSIFHTSTNVFFLTLINHRIYQLLKNQCKGVQKHILGQYGLLSYCLATKRGGKEQIDTVKIAHKLLSVKKKRKKRRRHTCWGGYKQPCEAQNGYCVQYLDFIVAYRRDLFA